MRNVPSLGACLLLVLMTATGCVGGADPSIEDQSQPSNSTLNETWQTRHWDGFVTQANVSGQHVTVPPQDAVPVQRTHNRTVDFEVTPATQRLELELEAEVSEMVLRIAPPNCTVENAEGCGWVVPTEGLQADWARPNITEGIWHAQMNVQTTYSSTSFELTKSALVPVLDPAKN